MQLLNSFFGNVRDIKLKALRNPNAQVDESSAQPIKPLHYNIIKVDLGVRQRE